MLPSQLTAAEFDSYPPQARAYVVSQLDLLRQLPLSFAALLLREMSSYDWRFPAERRALNDQFAYLGSLSSPQRAQLLHGFAAVSLPDAVLRIDWIRNPEAFIDALTSSLWSTHQIDAFRQAASGFNTAWRQTRPEPAPPVARVTVVVLGAGLKADDYPLFRKLRPHGVFFPRVDGTDAWPEIASFAARRAAAHPIEYGHWYVDGREADAALRATLVTTSYQGLKPAREALLSRMQRVIASGHGGPEELRTIMAETTPTDLGLPAASQNDPVRRFEVSVLTEGSGTQIFSTTFVQWTAREALRRAQPCTMVLRYAPRQRQLPMNEMLSGKDAVAGDDPQGSLVDADMGAYYTWINQQRLTGAEQSSFLAWSEAHRQAVVIGPGMPRQTVSDGTVTMRQLLAQLS
jgi:hypothetical protein